MPSFPTLASGVSVHLPYQVVRRFENDVVRQPHGWQYAYNRRSTPLKRAQIQFLVSDADMATLRNFFIARGGGYETFDFTDPGTGENWAKCVFDQESFDVQFVGANENQVTLSIRELP